MSKAEEATNKTSGEEKSDQASDLSRRVTAQLSVNRRMVENVLLIWLDNSIDQNNSDDYHNTINQLQRVANTINTFTDVDQCIKFLTSTNNEKVVMIISDALCRYTVPLVHDTVQLDAIFILCKNKTSHEEWTKVWPKIRGVFTEIAPISEALKQVVSQYEHNTIPMSFMTINDIDSKNLDQLDCSFMYTQILKEILFSIKFEQKHIKKFVNYCRTIFADDNYRLNSIKSFESKYHEQPAIWWYTGESFLYQMLNHALRKMEVDTIIEMGFFISDLHHDIERLHSKESNGHPHGTTFTVYRGQGMSKADFDRMTKSKGGLMSFNNFLSTSKKYDVSFLFADSNQGNLDLVGILFVMTIDSSKLTTPFTSITENGFYGNSEDEVLFSMHTIFRIHDIKPMNENHRLFQVDLTLTSDEDQDLRALTDFIRKEIPSDIEGWRRLGGLLLTLGLPEKAQQLYQLLLEEATDEIEVSAIYNQLGTAKSQLGDYKEAIEFYKKSLEIDQKIRPANHPNLVTSYNNIGLVYSDMNENCQALLSYEKALAIQQQSLPPNHPNFTMTYSNIGNVYHRMGDHSKALSSYEKALAIKQQSLPPNHPDLAASFNNIGIVYYNMDENSQALSSYEKALEIQQQSLPSNHPELAATHNNIASVYYNMDDYPQALSSFEKALAIKQQSLPPNHPGLASAYNNISAVYEHMNDYSKALSFLERALDIGQQSLSSNHPHLQMYRKKLDKLKKKL
jgi:tetratricopeptide (TPR) repeat protein